MGAFNPLAGKNFNVAIGSSTMAFDSASLEMKDGLSDVTNFTSQGYAQFISGIRDGKINLSGPYDESNMAASLGGSVTITFFYTPSVTIVVPGIIESIKPDIKVKDAERIAITVQSSGVFASSIV